LAQDIGYAGNTMVMGGILEVANFNPATAATSIVDIEAGAQLIADSIMVNTLTIGAGAKVTIRPLTSSPPLTNMTSIPVPEPSSLLLTISGVLLCCAFRTFRNKKTKHQKQ
jgi:hypothetical protein